jgi:hypothetical protein
MPEISAADHDLCRRRLSSCSTRNVRDEIRRRGVDPLTDPRCVPTTSAACPVSVRPVADPESAVDEIVARVSGFGPLQRYLDDPRLPFGMRRLVRSSPDKSLRPIHFRGGPAKTASSELLTQQPILDCIRHFGLVSGHGAVRSAP